MRCELVAPVGIAAIEPIAGRHRPNRPFRGHILENVGQFGAALVGRREFVRRGRRPCQFGRVGKVIDADQGRLRTGEAGFLVVPSRDRLVGVDFDGAPAIGIVDRLNQHGRLVVGQDRRIGKLKIRVAKHDQGPTRLARVSANSSTVRPTPRLIDGTMNDTSQSCPNVQSTKSSTNIPRRETAIDEPPQTERPQVLHCPIDDRPSGDGNHRRAADIPERENSLRDSSGGRNQDDGVSHRSRQRRSTFSSWPA